MSWYIIGIAIGRRGFNRGCIIATFQQSCVSLVSDDRKGVDMGNGMGVMHWRMSEKRRGEGGMPRDRWLYHSSHSRTKEGSSHKRRRTHRFWMLAHQWNNSAVRPRWPDILPGCIPPFSIFLTIFFNTSISRSIMIISNNLLFKVKKFFDWIIIFAYSRIG